VLERFSFGLWTVGWRAQDPFGDPTRPPLDPVESVHRLAELGAWGVSFHDDDLVPFGTASGERDKIIERFKAALAEPTLALGESLSDLAADEFDADAVGARGYGFVRLAQLALEHLLGAR
jgi:xylose isomerase